MRLLPKCYHEAYAFVLEREFACAAKSRPLLPESEPGTPHPPSSSSTATATAGSFLERHVGELIAAAAAILLEALGEFRDRGLTHGPRWRPVT